MTNPPTRLLFATLIAANLLAWGWAWAAFGTHPVLLGTALLAWVFGPRHAVDTADNVMMVRAYGWAFVHPLRKLWYNLTVTTASVLVALLIGGIEALALLGEFFVLDGWLWRAVASLNQNLAGFGLLVVGIFAGCWAISAAIYRWKNYETVVERA